MSCTLVTKRLLLLIVLFLILSGLVMSSAYAQTVSVVYNFGSQVGDPIQPFYSGIIAQGQDGNLYSSTFGGSLNYGALYEVTPQGVLTESYAFPGPAGGAEPYGGLTLGTDGNFHGTTYGGGFYSDGTIFTWTSTTGLNLLYGFSDSTDGAQPTAPPIEGADGNFYGTTCPQGAFSTGYGSIYKITPSGTFTSLYDFDSTHGYCPYDPLLQGTDGNLYGTTFFGGTNCISGVSCGVVFRITPAGKLTVLHNFCAQTSGNYCSDGEGPVGPLVQGSDGNFYGTTEAGGVNNFGVVFKMTPTGKLTVLHSMTSADGYVTDAGLVQATDGNFYGANSGGGSNASCISCGTIFRITPKGAFKKLYDFDGTTGQAPYTTMIQHTNGLLYGTTQLGGTGSMAVGCGVGECGVFYSLNIGAAPFVTFVGQPVAKVGKTVEILGQGLTGTTAVSFGGVPASFKVKSDTYLTATTPAGTTTAAVTVTTPGGKLVSNKTFRVTPQFKTFTPASGPVGTVVTITGVSLTQASKVTFGGVAAAFTVDSDTQITATVPTGAKTGKIVITTPGGTASSATSFTVTT